MNIPLVSLRNLRRKPVRTAILSSIVAAVAATLFSATLLLTGAANALSTGAGRLGADILVVPAGAGSRMRTALLSGEPTHFLMERAILDRIRTREDVSSASPQLFIKPTPFTCCYGVDVFLIAIDPATDFTIRPWLESGRARRLETGELITGSAVPVLLGDIIPFFGTAFRIAGTMAPTGMDFFDRAAFMNMESAYRMAEQSGSKAQQELRIPRNRISAVLVKVREGVPPEQAAVRIEQASPGVNAIVSDTVINTVRKQLKDLERAAVLMAVMLWSILLLIMGFAFSLIASERRREIGLLRAMGAGKRHILMILLGEAGMVSAAGGASGAAIGLSAVMTFRGLLNHALGLPFLIPAAGPLLALLLAAVAASVLTGLAAAAAAMRNVLKREPYEAIRREE